MAGFLQSAYLWIKALHIIMVIAWMAGMMYLPRLFIYHHQSTPGSDAEQFFVTMERRLLKGIMTPALIAVWILAILMIIANPDLLQSWWFRIKLLLVLGISGIHGFYAASQRKFEAADRVKTEKFWRFMNEGPFLLLVGVVFLAVVKPF